MTPLSDTDRDTAVHRLQEAFAQGRLSSGDMEERLERALTATSHGELEPALAGLPDDVVELRSTGGRFLRVGDWRVPRMLRIDSVYGKVRLDLSQATIEHPVIHIELRLAYGSATVVLPPGASADADGARTLWGRATCRVPQRSGRPHIRISGELGYGSLMIRYPRAWAR
ncbi:DUF1707 SHOCT-like domain-containing protein [Nonomuraea sp. LPB2021202275-12-8]|uniref:DUF1707 SHOCT-like domain-containing protein n=1 Tax=Nonomuraea sp. LPB2021202275-12-8 TaxID=3120159 RepID=UPI00300D4463